MAKVAPPVYGDGFFQWMKKGYKTIGDFKQEVVSDTGYQIWYREVALYDRVRATLDTAGIEVTMKVRIPQFKEIKAGDSCVIDGEQHEVYNVAHLVNRSGYPETEITLKTPLQYREIV